MNYLKSIHFREHSFSLISRILSEHANINARKIFKISKKALATRKFCALLCKPFVYVLIIYMEIQPLSTELIFLIFQFLIHTVIREN